MRAEVVRAADEDIVADRMPIFDYTSHGGARDPKVVAVRDAPPAQLGTKVKKLLLTHGHCYLWAVGPEAISNAVKALALARTYLLDEGQSLIVVPEWGRVRNSPTSLTYRTWGSSKAIRFTVRRVFDDAVQAPVATPFAEPI